MDPKELEKLNILLNQKVNLKIFKDLLSIIITIKSSNSANDAPHILNKS